MDQLTQTPVVADHAQFGVRVTYDTKGDTIVSKIDLDHPCSKAATQAGKLAAITCLLNGDTLDAFNDLAESHKRNFIWMLDDLAHEVLALTQLASHLHCYPANTGASHD